MVLELIDAPILRYVLSAVLFATGLALQFVSLYQSRIDRLAPRYPALKWIKNRWFQLIAGFTLLSAAIKLIQGI